MTKELVADYQSFNSLLSPQFERHSERMALRVAFFPVAAKVVESKLLKFEVLTTNRTSSQREKQTGCLAPGAKNGKDHPLEWSVSLLR